MNILLDIAGKKKVHLVRHHEYELRGCVYTWGDTIPTILECMPSQLLSMLLVLVYFMLSYCC
jgi:hypothetical protein